MIRWSSARQSAGFVVVLVSALLVSACATVPADNEDWRGSQRPVIKQKAESRWTAMIEGDVKTAYEYLSPDYRSVVSLQQYKKKFGAAVAWRLARVDDIRYDSPTVATVLVKLTYETDLPGARGELIQSTREMQEKWLYKDGGWWYTSQ